MPWQDYKPYFEPLDCFREQDEQLHILRPRFDSGLGFVRCITTCFAPDNYGLDIGNRCKNYTPYFPS